MGGHNPSTFGSTSQVIVSLLVQSVFVRMSKNLQDIVTGVDRRQTRTKWSIVSIVRGIRTCVSDVVPASLIPFVTKWMAIKLVTTAHDKQQHMHMTMSAAPKEPSPETACSLLPLCRRSLFSGRRQDAN